LTLFYVDRLAGRACRDQKIRLTAEEGRDLKDIDDLCHRCALIGRVNVSENRKASGGADPLERSETGIDARAASRVAIRAIGLIEAGLVDDAARHTLGQASQRFADPEIEVVVLENARAGYQKKSCGRK
jgi:hypothetical protein